MENSQKKKHGTALWSAQKNRIHEAMPYRLHTLD